MTFSLPVTPFHLCPLFLPSSFVPHFIIKALPLPPSQFLAIVWWEVGPNHLFHPWGSRIPWCPHTFPHHHPWRGPPVRAWPTPHPGLGIPWSSQLHSSSSSTSATHSGPCPWSSQRTVPSWKLKYQIPTLWPQPFILQLIFTHLPPHLSLFL